MHAFLSFLAVGAVALVVPGPDTFVVLRTSLADGARARTWAAAGSAGSSPARPAEPPGQTSRRSVAQRVSWWRFDSCSLRSTLLTWVSTVLIEMNSSLATSLYA